MEVIELLDCQITLNLIRWHKSKFNVKCGLFYYYVIFRLFCHFTFVDIPITYYITYWNSVTNCCETWRLRSKCSFNEGAIQTRDPKYIRVDQFRWPWWTRQFIYASGRLAINGVCWMTLWLVYFTLRPNHTYE